MSGKEVDAERQRLLALLSSPECVEAVARVVHSERKQHEAFDYEDEDVAYAQAALSAIQKMMGEV